MGSQRLHCTRCPRACVCLCATYELNYSCNEQRNKSDQAKKNVKLSPKWLALRSVQDIMDQLPYRLHRVDSLFIIYYYCCYYLVLFDFSTFIALSEHTEQSEVECEPVHVCVCGTMIVCVFMPVTERASFSTKSNHSKFSCWTGAREWKR